MADPRDTQWFLRRMPSKQVVLDTIKGDPVDRLLGVAAARAIVEIGFDPLAKPDQDQQALADALTLAASAAERVAREGEQAVLSDEEKAALDLYILLVARPAILIRGGRVPERPDNWKEIARDEELFPDVIAGVGRIETAAGVKCGTGFLVADRRIVTNNHVLVFLFGEDALGKWSRDPQWFAQQVDEHHELWQENEASRPQFELIGEFGNNASTMVRVSGIRGHHRDVDLAVLELDATPAGGEVLPLHASEPQDFGTRSIYVVGYPIEPRYTPIHVVHRVFGADRRSLGMKRFSPGKVIEWTSGSRIFSHDASTLGGSSGSAVVDFESHRVVGLHFQGRYDTSNEAVALFALRHDPLLTANGVQFS